MFIESLRLWDPYGEPNWCNHSPEEKKKTNWRCSSVFGDLSVPSCFSGKSNNLCIYIYMLYMYILCIYIYTAFMCIYIYVHINTVYIIYKLYLYIYIFIYLFIYIYILCIYIYIYQLLSIHGEIWGSIWPNPMIKSSLIGKTITLGGSGQQNCVFFRPGD